MKNNDFSDNSGSKNEKIINKNIKNKQFIYEKKNKKLFDNYLRKNEEEKNNQNKNKIGIDKNFHKKEYENKKEVYEEIINTNIDKDNKNIRYSKKIKQERINKKIKENDNINNINNLDKNKIKDEETSESNTINEGVPVLNDSNNIIDNFDSSEKKEKCNYKINDIFKYDKKKRNIFKVTEINEIPGIFDEENNENENENYSHNSSKVDDNLNIDKELKKKIK